MSISMYQVLIPSSIHALHNLINILQKTADHALAKKVAPDVFIDARLFPDMFPLARQVQIASDTAKGAAARLAGMEPPSYEDDETTFTALIERVQKTIRYLETFTPDQIDGSEERTVTLRMRSGTATFQGMPYLLSFVLPNLYFHISTAYAIARHGGVDLGKQDYLGKLY
jgi:uncharacterized protein